ncbi:hypothetical protein HYT45_04020 [Candidatus Uhrbacteria bacterium]|nr:hypothetical protein [Candidatus Uhrbacteria bacterium]
MGLNLRPRRWFGNKKKVALISNKNSGLGTPRAGLGKVIGSILTTPYWHYDTATLSELDESVKRIASEQPDIFAFTGGDGSVHQIISRILREYSERGIPLPKFLYIGTGTMMVIARSLKLDKMSAVDFTKKITAKIEAQQKGLIAPFDTTHVNPLMINGEGGFLYGAGLPVNLLHEYYKGGDKLGPSRAMRVGLATFWDELKALLTFRKSKKMLTKPVHARVILPGLDPPVAPYMTHTVLLVSSVDQLGMGCRGMPLAMSKPNHFMLRSSRLEFWGLAANLPAIWAGWSPLPSTFDVVLSELVIEYESPTETMVDGEMKPPTFRDVIISGPPLEFITG